MKLYNSNLSPFASRVRAQIYAKGLSVELVDPPGGPHSPEYANINPMEKIPALDDNGFHLPESATIMDYIEDRFPNPSLRPEDPKARATVRLLARIADLYILGALVPLFAQVNPKTRDEKVTDAALTDLAKALVNAERYLDQGNYAVGGRLSLADCTLAPALFFVEKLGPAFGRSDLFPGKLKAYWAAIQRDPTIAKVLKEQDVALAQRLGASRA